MADDLKAYVMNDALWTDQMLKSVYGRRSAKLDVDAVVTLDIAVSKFGPVTVAQLTSPPPHNNVYRGWAKKSKEDKNNPSAGTSLAVARALQHYVNALESEANRLTNEQPSD